MKKIDNCLNKEEAIIKILEELGLTSTEALIYIFLARRGPKKGKELIEALKLSRQRLYRGLREMQSEGLIYCTLERPASFAAYSFEEVCNLAIKRKIDEANALKKNQKELSSILDACKDETPIAQARTMVIQGEKNIYRKAAEMINCSKCESLSIISLKDLLSANTFGLFESIITESSESLVNHRYITDISHENVTQMKKFLEKNKGYNLKGRAMNDNMKSVPRFIIKDNKAVLYFISSKNDKSLKDEAIGFWTNSTEFVYALKNMYEYLWQNSADIERKIAIMETGDLIPDFQMLTEPETALKKYTEKVTCARKEIIVTLSKNSIGFFLQIQNQLKDAIKQGVTIKIIAPLSKEDIESLKRISPLIELRISDKDYTGISIIDNEHMFLFKATPLAGCSDIELMLYCNDTGIVRKTKNIFDDLWNNSISWLPLNSSVHNYINQ